MSRIISITFSVDADTLIWFVSGNDNYSTALPSQEFVEWIENAEELITNFLRCMLFHLDEHMQDTVVITSMVQALKNS